MKITALYWSAISLEPRMNPPNIKKRTFSKKPEVGVVSFQEFFRYEFETVLRRESIGLPNIMLSHQHS